MKWIKDNAGLFYFCILLGGLFWYGLNTQQKIMDVRFEAIEARFESRFKAVESRFEARFESIEKDLQTVKADIRRLELQLNRLDNKLNQLIISLVGKDKAAVIKKQAEDLFADTRPVAPPTEKNERNMAEDVSSKTRPVASENKQVQTK